MSDSPPPMRRVIPKAGPAAPVVALRSLDAAGGDPSSTRRSLVRHRAQVSLTVNGEALSCEVDTRTTLLDFLRERLHLTGSKKGCDHGQCGACTVIADGRRINSCLSLLVLNEGASITTIEGLSDKNGQLHPMQAAFIEHDGFQCGYCTPGQICSAVAMLEEARAGWPSHVTAEVSERPQLSDDEIRERMSGNLCRCAAYRNILAAIKDAGGIA